MINNEILAALIPIIGTIVGAFAVVMQQRSKTRVVLADNERLKTEAEKNDDSERNALIKQSLQLVANNNDALEKLSAELSHNRDSDVQRNEVLTTTLKEMTDQLRALRIDVREYPEAAAGALNIVSNDVRNLSANIRSLTSRLEGIEELPKLSIELRNDIALLSRKCTSLMEQRESEKAINGEKDKAA